MLTISKPAPNRVDVTLSGTLDADQMRQGLDALITASEDVSEGRMLYTIKDFAIPSMAALGVEFAQLPELFGLVGRFDRCAVLSDLAWMRTAAVVKGAVMPGIEIRSFELDDVAAADAWLEEQNSQARDL